MIKRLFENTFLAYVFSSILSAVVAYNIYSLYFDAGVVFETPLIEYIEHVLYLNLILLSLAQLVLITAIRSIWDYVPLRLLLNYVGIATVTVYYVYQGVVNGFTVEHSVHNFVTLAFYMLFYTILYRRRGLKFVKN